MEMEEDDIKTWGEGENLEDESRRVVGSFWQVLIHGGNKCQSCPVYVFRKSFQLFLKYTMRINTQNREFNL